MANRTKPVTKRRVYLSRAADARDDIDSVGKRRRGGPEKAAAPREAAQRGPRRSRTADASGYGFGW